MVLGMRQEVTLQQSRAWLELQRIPYIGDLAMKELDQVAGDRRGCIGRRRQDRGSLMRLGAGVQQTYWQI